MSTTPTTTRRVITRQAVDWAAWDWGSAAFNAVATTFVFTRRVRGVGHVKGAKRGSFTLDAHASPSTPRRRSQTS